MNTRQSRESNLMRVRGRELGLGQNNKWYEHELSKILESQKYKTLPDFNAVTDSLIEVRRLAVVKKWTRQYLIIAFAASNYEKVDKRGRERKQQMIRAWPLSYRSYGSVRLKYNPVVMMCIKKYFQRFEKTDRGKWI